MQIKKVSNSEHAKRYIVEATKSLQEQFAPNSICFGCGPANSKGLRIKSFAEGDKTICHWHPEKHHEAFPGMLNGGIIGALLDCHSNWTAAWHLMKTNGLDQPPCTVTADFSVQLLRPTPSNHEVKLFARVVEAKPHKAKIESELYSGDDLCAKCSGTFVAVREGHPAFHRWS